MKVAFADLAQAISGFEIELHGDHLAGRARLMHHLATRAAHHRAAGAERTGEVDVEVVALLRRRGGARDGCSRG